MKPLKLLSTRNKRALAGIGAPLGGWHTAECVRAQKMGENTALVFRILTLGYKDHVEALVKGGKLQEFVRACNEGDLNDVNEYCGRRVLIKCAKEDGRVRVSDFDVMEESDLEHLK